MTTEVDDFLKHYGVMGMKWGIHKSKAAYQTSKEGVKAVRNAKHTTQEIKEARARQNARYNRQTEADDAYSLALNNKSATPAQRARLEKALKQRVSEARLSDDRIIATKMTRGEIWTTAFLEGQAGLTVNDMAAYLTDRDIARNR